MEKLLTAGKTNEQVIDWINSNAQVQMDSSEQMNAIFVRALVTAVVSAALHKTRSTSDGAPVHVSLNTEVLNSRAVLLHRYIDHNRTREAHALCALQLFDVQNDHPSAVLSDLFYKLFDDGIISEDAFRDWYDKKEPHEPAGFGVAKKAVNAFYTYLNEAEGDDD